MNVWITGGAGFFGNRLSRALTAQGYSVTSIDRRQSNYANHSIITDLASDNSIEVLLQTRSLYGEPEALIHTASRQPGKFPVSEYIKSNVLTTGNILDALAKFSSNQIIYTSTQSVFGVPCNNPVCEDDSVNPTSNYALTKLWAENLLKINTSNKQVTVLRLPSMYGYGQADSFIDGLSRLAMNNQDLELFHKGTIIRDALYVEDVVSAIISCISNPPGENYCLMNLGCGEKLTTLDYAKAVVDALDSRSKIILVDRFPPNQIDLYANIDKARMTIGFQPTPLTNALKRYAHELRA